MTIFLAIFRFISKNHEYFRPFRECFNANTISLYNGQMSISVVNVFSVKVLLLILKVFDSIFFSFFHFGIFFYLRFSNAIFFHIYSYAVVPVPFLSFFFFCCSFLIRSLNRGALLLENLNLYKIYYMVNVTHSWVCLKIHEQKRKEEKKIALYWIPLILWHNSNSQC